MTKIHYLSLIMGILAGLCTLFKMLHGMPLINFKDGLILASGTIAVAVVNILGWWLFLSAVQWAVL